MEKRDKFRSRIGFILISAGCAIGLGNVWTFPWRTGNNGGGAFVFCYIIALLLLGLPIMTAEFSLGRASQKSPVLMYQALEKPNQKWHIHGYISVFGNFFLMMFYTTIAGYFFHYFIKFLTGTSAGLTFGDTFSNLGVNVFYTILTVCIGFFVLSFNLQKGFEKVGKYMMLLLFALMFVLVIHSCTMSGAKEGLTFYLKPDFSKINGTVIIAAMNQAFFSLGLGVGSMAIFGSYIDKNHTLLGESVNVIALDTLVAIMAGFIIFPACFTFNINPGAGPALLFTTMTALFNDMAGGRFWGTLFFLFMIFAAMSTIFAVYENILAMVRDLTGWSRKKGCLILCFVMIALCMPMALSGSVLSAFQPFGEGTGFLDLWDFLIETLIQPVGSACYLIFCSNKFGWGWENFKLEANSGNGFKVQDWMRVFFKFVSPIIILGLWIYGLLTFFHII